MSIQRSETQLNANGKSLKLYLAAPPTGGPGVLVLPSWWGLKPFFKEVCDTLAEKGYTALAPDYYQGRVAKAIPEAEALSGEAESDPEAFAALIKASKDHLASLRKGQPIAILGASMGTDWALIMGTKESDVTAIVLHYGIWGGLDFSTMKAKVLGHFAEKDEWNPAERVKDAQEKMNAAGVDLTFHTYAGTAHWFIESDRPEYNAAAAQLAWTRTYEFLRQNLK
jgi:carboxymethylenebutenolidase